MMIARCRVRGLLAALAAAGTCWVAASGFAQETVLDQVLQQLRARNSDAETAPDRAQESAATSPRELDGAAHPSAGAAKITAAAARQKDRIRLEQQNGLITLMVRDATVSEVLDVMAHEQSLNVVTAENIRAKVSIHLRNVALEDALTSILSVAGYSWVRHNDIIVVTDATASGKLAPHAQGRELRVFRLDYASAQDISAAVRGLLSPVGQTFIAQLNKQDNRRTAETVVVEDMPAYLERIQDYISQIDQAPKQVLIEAHVLQVNLRDDYANGLNILYNSSRPGGRNVKFDIRGFASPSASPGVLFTVEGTDLSTLLEMLQTTVDAKTLANPKVLVVNGQEARFQVGQQLGFRVITTTETSTLQSVDFIDVGVQLRVTPYVSRDNQVMMHVRPEVSSGRINPTTELPEEETTHVETDVLLADGRGMVIGGLIQEQDSKLQSKVPWLGNLRLLGRLFKRRDVNRSRNEVIITLVPHVVPLGGEHAERDRVDVTRSHTPLFEGALQAVPRPWEPSLPDPAERPLQFPRFYRDRLPHGPGVTLQAPCRVESDRRGSDGDFEPHAGGVSDGGVEPN